MTKTTSKKGAWCRSIALIPVFLAAFCVFSTKTFALNEPSTLFTYESVENPIMDNERMEIPEKEQLPNVFIPNADGNNARFLKGYDLEVYNRMGSRLYQGTDGWDGTNKGEQLNEGAYYYIAKRPLNNEQQQIFKGSVLLKKPDSQPETKSTQVKEDCDLAAEGIALEQRYTVRLNAAKPGEQALSRQAFALRKDNRYRFSICTEEGSAGEAILQLFDRDELIGSSYNPETGSTQQYFDIDIEKTSPYVVLVSFKGGKEGSAVASIYHVGRINQVEN